MGCDIHAYVEYGEHEHFGRSAVGRDYYLFGLLTRGQVRSSAGPAVAPEPRGVPGRISAGLADEFLIKVVPDDDPRGDEYGMVGLSRARSWTGSAYGNNAFCLLDDGYISRLSELPDPVPDELRVEHPDWHSASWLDASELERVLEAYSNTVDYGVEEVLIAGWDPPAPRRKSYVEIPWFEEQSIPGPVASDAQELALLLRAVAGGRELAAEAVRRFRADGKVEFVRVGDRISTLGPHVRMDAILRAMRELPDARFVFWFDN